MSVTHLQVQLAYDVIRVIVLQKELNNGGTRCQCVLMVELASIR